MKSQSQGKPVTPNSVQKEKPKKNRLKSLLIDIGFIVLVLIIFCGSYFGYAKAYEGRIYPKIQIADINVGGMTTQEATSRLEDKIKALSANGPEITYEDQVSKPSFEDLGIQFDVKDAIQKAVDYGRQGNLKQKFSENYIALAKGFKITLTPSIDQTKLDEYLVDFAKNVEKKPVNASLKVENGQIILSSSQSGVTVDQTKFKQDLMNIVNSGNIAGKVELTLMKSDPEIKEADTELPSKQAEQYLKAAPIVVTYEDRNWSANREEIGTWISFTPDQNNIAVSISPKSFINSISGQVEISAQDREIEEGTGNILNEGRDGLGIDTNQLEDQIHDALIAGQTATIALPVFAIPRQDKTVYPHAQPGRYSGRYIDVNLSEQTLYAFEGGTQVKSFLVSTGKRGYETPTGEFNVYAKTSSQLMDGPDYYLPNVPWISWISGDYSIHGTYWHSNFGTPMSHGCINASTPDAEWVYNWVDIGTPVFIHY